MRGKFDRQLTLLNREMVAMGTLCETAIATSVRALLTGDVAVAQTVGETAAEIEEKERQIEAMCLKLLLQQQPVARDLRTISSALKMVTDMERVGRQSADIAEIIAMAHIAASDDTLCVREMANATIAMVTDSVDAFVRRDAEIARRVIAQDDVVDRYFDEIKAELIRRFSQPETDGEYALDLLMIAKYFERIGDHAVNIARWVLFSITGSREEGKV